MSTTPGSAILNIYRDGQLIQSCPVSEEVLLGREKDCAVILDDRAVSRHHALFRWAGKDFQVENKSKFSPLSVNGIECTSALLKGGDLVTVGPFQIQVAGGGQAEAATAPIAESSPVQKVDSQPASPLPPPEVASLPVLEESAFLQSEPPSDAKNEDPIFGDPLANQTEEPNALRLDSPENSSDSESSNPSAPISDSDATRVAPQSQLVASLVFPPGAANVEVFEIQKDEVSIGRGKSCDIVLKDKKSSRKNAVLRRAGAQFTLIDQGSANGTLVNGVKIQEQQLSGGDEIAIGTTKFRFNVEQAGYSERAAQFLTPIEEVGETPEPPFEPQQVDAPPYEPPPSQQAFPLPDGIAGISGPDFSNGLSKNSATKSGSKSLLDKLPPPARFAVLAAVIGVLFWANQDEEEGAKTKGKKGAQAVAKKDKSLKTIEDLPKEQRAYVEAQYQLGFNYFKSRDYDKAILEIDRIFEFVSDYKDARDIRQMAEQGKKVLLSIEEERKRKEEEAKLKERIGRLIEEIGKKMAAKQYDAAREQFAELLSIDPDNPAVAAWKKEIEAYEEELRVKKQQAQLQMDLNRVARDLLNEGLKLKKAGKFHSAISTLGRVLTVGASEKSIANEAARAIAACRAAIRMRREPVLKDARAAEAAGDRVKAFELYKKATQIDPPHPEGHAGMKRIRGALHEQAKVIYTEAVLAENYSDFDQAKKLFEQCLQVAPDGDLYHERAARKLSRYFDQPSPPPAAEAQGEAATAAPPQESPSQQQTNSQPPTGGNP